MEQKNDQIKQILIKQYSKLYNTSETILTEKLCNADWWSKEQSRLRIQNKIIQTVSFIIFIFCCFILVFSSLNGTNNHLIGVPLISVIGLFIAIVMMQTLRSTIEAKIRFFEILKVLFDK